MERARTGHCAVSGSTVENTGKARQFASDFTRAVEAYQKGEKTPADILHETGYHYITETERKVDALKERLEKLQKDDDITDSTAAFKLEKQIFELEHPPKDEDSILDAEYIGGRGFTNRQEEGPSTGPLLQDTDQPTGELTTPAGCSALGKRYEFDGLRMDPSERVLYSPQGMVPLLPMSVDLLLVLIERRDRFVSKRELMETLWPDTFVGEDNLSQNLSQLRKALKTIAPSRKFIETAKKMRLSLRRWDTGG